MLKTFALIALIHGQAYTMDYDMSYDDCRLAMAEGVSTIQIDADTWIDAAGASLMCVVDSAE
ncbi:hypothetical protein WKW50_16210 [Ochrobactrum sp. GPK 3]